MRARWDLKLHIEDLCFRAWPCYCRLVLHIVERGIRAQTEASTVNRERPEADIAHLPHHKDNGRVHALESPARYYIAPRLQAVCYLWKVNQHALVYLLHIVSEAIDRGNSWFFADFKKGFVLIDHQIMMKRYLLSM